MSSPTPSNSSSSWWTWVSGPVAWAQEQWNNLDAEIEEVEEADLLAESPTSPEPTITAPLSPPKLVIDPPLTPPKFTIDPQPLTQEDLVSMTDLPAPSVESASSLSTWSSKSLTWIQEQWNSVDAQAEKEIKEELATKPNPPPIASSEPENEPHPSPIASVSSSAAQIISDLHRPIVVDGHDINPLRKPLTEEAAQTSKQIAKTIIEINENKFAPAFPRPEEIPGVLIIPDAVPVPPTDHSKTDPAKAKQIAAEELKKIQAQTDLEQATLISHITAYTTLQFLHEWAAGQKPAESFNTYRPVLEKYHKQLFLAKERNQPNPSLWTLYKETLGAELTFFQKAKAALCYFIFYFGLRLIPNAVASFTNQIIDSFRKDLTTSPTVASLTSKILTQTSIILTKYEAALKNCAAQQGRAGTPDECKEGAVNELMTKEPLDEIIAEVSNIFVDQFFPRLKLCTKWKESPVAIVRWVGIFFAAILETPVNWIIKRVLRNQALPSVLHAIADNTASESPQIALVFSRAIYEEANKQLVDFQEKLAKEEPEDPTPLLQLPPHDKLTLNSVAKLLISVVGMTPHKNVNDLIKHLADEESKSSNTLRAGLEGGIEKIAHIALAKLHDQNQVEEILSKILSASNEAFLNSETFEQIRESQLTHEKALKITSKEVFRSIVRRSIKEKSDPSFKPVAAQTDAIHKELRQNILAKAADLQNLFSTMATKVLKAQNGPLLNQHVILHDIKLFCDRMEELRLIMNIASMDANTPGLTEALKEELDRILQPMREKSLHLLEAVGRLKKYQQENKKHAHIAHVLQEIFSFNEQASRLISEDTPNSLETQFRRLEQLASEVTPHLPEESKERLSALTKSSVQSLSDFINHHTRLEKLHLLIKPNGPIANLVIVRHGGKVPQFHIDLAKDTIADILKDLPATQREELTKALDRMLSKQPAQGYQWNPLKEFLLQQLPPELQNRVGQHLDASFQKMPRGQEIPADVWSHHAALFLQEFTSEEQKLVRPLLKQMHRFLSHNSILHAYGVHFHQKIKKYCVPYAQARDAAYQAYAKDSEALYLLTTNLIPSAIETRQASHTDMIRELKWIQKELNELNTLGQDLALQKPHDLKVLATAIGGVIGAPVGMLTTAALGTTLGPLAIVAGSTATAFGMNYYNENRAEETVKGGAAGLFGGAVAAIADAILPGAGTLIGAAMGSVNGAFAGSKASDLVLDWGDKEVVPELETWLDNFLLEATDPNTRKIASYSFLQIFAKAYRRASRS